MAQAIAITGGRVVPVEGDPIDGGTVVLQDGTMIADGPPAEVVALPAVQQAYLGMQRGAEPRRGAGHG